MAWMASSWHASTPKLKPAAWTPPPPEVRELKALLARREALAQDLRRELNRQEKAFGDGYP